jgi:hypothetical protein
MGQVILLSLTASLNPTLVAATTVMLLLPSPSRLMLGYLLGAHVTSITLGLVIVFSASVLTLPAPDLGETPPSLLLIGPSQSGGRGP